MKCINHVLSGKLEEQLVAAGEAIERWRPDSLLKLFVG